MRILRITDTKKLIDNNGDKVLCPQTCLGMQCSTRCAWCSIHKLEDPAVIKCGSKVIGELDEFNGSSTNPGSQS